MQLTKIRKTNWAKLNKTSNNLLFNTISIMKNQMVQNMVLFL